MPWFAVRTFVRSKPTGLPKHRDRHFAPRIASVEERIVLFRAPNGSSAVKKGRLEAQRYVLTSRNKNVYGQRVTVALLPFVEAFELFETPSDRAEVFSSIEVINSSETPKQFLRRKVGKPSSAATARMFISASISKELTERLGSW